MKRRDRRPRVSPQDRRALAELERKARATATQLAALGPAGATIAARLAASGNPLDRRIAAEVQLLLAPRSTSPAA